jgi:hypothetical protein
MATPDSQLLVALSPVLLADSGDQHLDGLTTVHATRVGDWLEYWLAYPTDPDHQGTDYEMIMVLLTDDHPVCAVYAQHKWCRARAWGSIAHASGHPVVYVGRDKHASYFTPGWHRHGRHLERANGRRPLDCPLVLDVPDAVRHRAQHRSPGAWAMRHMRGSTPREMA